DMEMVGSIHEAIGPDVEFMIDIGPNAKWTVNDAIKYSRELEKFGIRWIEEPLVRSDYEGYAQLRKASRIPIAGGEWEYDLEGMGRYLSSQSMDIIQPDVGRFGGIQACKDAADIAARQHVKYSPHTWSTTVNTAATLQIL